jgi:hypothetical protein
LAIDRRKVQLADSQKGLANISASLHTIAKAAMASQPEAFNRPVALRQVPYRS